MTSDTLGDKIKAISECRQTFGRESVSLNNVLLMMEKEVNANKRSKVSVVFFTSKTHPKEIFRTEKKSLFDSEIEKYEDFYAIFLKRKIRRKNIESGERTVEGGFLLFESNIENIWISISTEKPDFLKSALLPFLKEKEPKVSRIYLSSLELREFFYDIERELEVEIFVKKAILYSHNPYSHKEQGIINFEKRYFEELFDEVEKKDLYVDKIEFMIKKDTTAYHGFVSRDSVMYFYEGKIGYLLNILIPKLEKKAKYKLDTFDNKKLEYGKPYNQTISIVYDRDIFSTPEDNFLFINAISKIHKGAITVYHKNPYLHLSLLDYIDGSIFDILVTERNKIDIVPSYEYTLNSLMRISEHISKEFHEGEISEIKTKSLTTEDFFR